jgi:hypothetical protein
MTQLTLKKNYEISIVHIMAEQYGVNIKLLVTDKKTGDYDVYSWGNGCTAAEAYDGSLWNNINNPDDLDVAIMEYMIKNLWKGLPIASKKQLKLVDKLYK